MSENIKIARNFAMAKERLYSCIEKNEIESIFKEYEFTDLSDKIEILRECMGVEEIFNSPGNVELSLNDEYEEEVEIFIEGTWRLLA